MSCFQDKKEGKSREWPKFNTSSHPGICALVNKLSLGREKRFSIQKFMLKTIFLNFIMMKNIGKTKAIRYYKKNFTWRTLVEQQYLKPCRSCRRRSRAPATSCWWSWRPPCRSRCRRWQPQWRWSPSGSRPVRCSRSAPDGRTGTLEFVGGKFWSLKDQKCSEIGFSRIKCII